LRQRVSGAAEGAAGYRDSGNSENSGANEGAATARDRAGMSSSDRGHLALAAYDAGQWAGFWRRYDARRGAPSFRCSAGCS
jgi:hypothetical protein